MIVVVLCTAPDLACAERLARLALEARLAACVSCLPQIVSFYHWQGEIQQQTEVQLLLKTDTLRQTALLRHLKTQHPYQIPELLVLPVSTVDEVYAGWLVDALNALPSC